MKWVWLIPGGTKHSSWMCHKQILSLQFIFIRIQFDGCNYTQTVSWPLLAWALNDDGAPPTLDTEGKTHRASVWLNKLQFQSHYLLAKEGVVQHGGRTWDRGSCAWVWGDGAWVGRLYSLVLPSWHVSRPGQPWCTSSVPKWKHTHQNLLLGRSSATPSCALSAAHKLCAWNHTVSWLWWSNWGRKTAQQVGANGWGKNVCVFLAPRMEAEAVGECANVGGCCTFHNTCVIQFSHWVLVHICECVWVFALLLIWDLHVC